MARLRLHNSWARKQQCKVNGSEEQSARRQRAGPTLLLEGTCGECSGGYGWVQTEKL